MLFDGFQILNQRVMGILLGVHQVASQMN